MNMIQSSAFERGQELTSLCRFSNATTILQVFICVFLPTVILFYQLRKQQHFSKGLPGIIFLNRASLWSQMRVLGQKRKGILMENNQQLQKPGKANCSLYQLLYPLCSYTVPSFRRENNSSLI